jgi:hypothetical protein
MDTRKTNYEKHRWHNRTEYIAVDHPDFPLNCLVKTTHKHDTFFNTIFGQPANFVGTVKEVYREIFTDEPHFIVLVKHRGKKKYETLDLEWLERIE